ncbi:GDSL-type esterase/lipase family protein [Leptolyngbya sp. AN02str]|uniref:GDSL-type esterase/lipase family protein n=1 Tax=Leptolyngbya sp. AN02str TaxID=3423363 RepID=UPI003D318ED6
MSELVLLAASMLVNGLRDTAHPEPLSPPAVDAAIRPDILLDATTITNAQLTVSRPEVSLPSVRPRYRRPITQATPRPPVNQEMQTIALRGDSSYLLPELAYRDVLPLPTPRPASGSQLYRQRVTALREGRTYTRLATNSYYEQWVNATEHPTYEQWMSLLRQEARSMAGGQGANRLSVLIGDSISQWYPPERLSGDRFWLNQGISGDTTGGVLRRLNAFAQTRPDTIHVMVGINDLRRGESDATILGNLQQIARQLRQQHPQARVVLYSILPTRLPAIPGDRIRQLNNHLAAIAHQEGANFMDLQTLFADETDNLRPDLTTDGLHLNPSGYAVWHWALRSFV